MKKETSIPQINSPELTDAADKLKQTGTWKGNLPAEEIQTLTMSVASQLLGLVPAGISITGEPACNVTIAPSSKDGRNMLTIDATANVDAIFVKTGLHVKINFKNKPDGSLETTGLTVEATNNSSIVTDKIETAKNVIGTQLQDPDELFRTALNAQMNLRGARVNKSSVTINTDNVSIAITDSREFDEN